MIRVRVPATSANLGPGFDTLGLALSLYLQVDIEWSDQNIIEFAGEGAQGNKSLPERNLVWQAADRVIQTAGHRWAVKLRIYNEIPMGKGLGSSAAAIVAGLTAANELLGKPLPQEQVLALAVEMEGHPDNVVPAFMGGLTTAMVDNKQVYYQKVRLPDEIGVVIVVPEFELPTGISRSVLPQQIDLNATVSNLQRACFLLASLHNRDFSNLDKAMDDQIYQPLRKQFIPGFDQVMKAAKSQGAIGTALSGAGPSILAFCTASEQNRVAQAMQEAFSAAGVRSRGFSLQIDNKGTEILTDLNE
jgi:homoserine kinase